MKVLRLGFSDDTYGDIPPEWRSWYIGAQKLAAETAEPWDTALEPAWPSRAWPEAIDRRIAEENPDLILLSCAGFWVSYPSAPLRMHRSKLPMGEKVARAGFWIGSKPVIADRKVFHLARRALIRPANVAFYFTPEKAFDSVERAIRTVLQHEKIALAVRGPLPINIAGPAGLRELCESRRLAFHNSNATLCDTLHVEYLGFEPHEKDAEDELAGDRLHVNARGHAARAGRESDLLIRAWRAHTAKSRD